jgi:hypothetical protein
LDPESTVPGASLVRLAAAGGDPAAGVLVVEALRGLRGLRGVFGDDADAEYSERSGPRLEQWLRASGWVRGQPILALGEHVGRGAFGHRHEDRFWSVAAIAWRDSLAPKLFERMIAGHDNREVRRSAATCFAQHAATSRGQLVSYLLPRNARRLLEIFLDLRDGWSDKDDRPLIEPFVQAVVQAVPKEIAEVASVLLDKAKPTPMLKGPALEVVRSLDPRGNMELALENAKLLVKAGEDASDLITILVNSPRGDEGEDIARTTDALGLAVTRGLWHFTSGSTSLASGQPEIVPTLAFQARAIRRRKAVSAGLPHRER